MVSCWLKIKPIELTIPWLPFGARAITLWPFIFYEHGAKTRRRQTHELYHWHQALRWGVLPWYLAYVLLLPAYFWRIRQHPLERLAYQAGREAALGVMR